MSSDSCACMRPSFPRMPSRMTFAVACDLAASLAWCPFRTTRRGSPALSAELGRHDSWVWAVAALSDGKVVAGGADGQVLVWDPAIPGRAPAELGRTTTACGR